MNARNTEFFPIRFRMDKWVRLEEFFEDESLVSFDIEANDSAYNILRIGFFVDENWENGVSLKFDALSKNFQYHLDSALSKTEIHEIIEEKMNDYHAELANESRN